MKQSAQEFGNLEDRKTQTWSVGSKPTWILYDKKAEKEKIEIIKTVRGHPLKPTQITRYLPWIQEISIIKKF